MAAGDTDLSVCSDALILMGASPISSFTEGTDAAQACDRLYPDLRDTLLSTYHWTWNVKKVQLSQLSTPPLNEFEHAYQLPGDMLSGVLALFDSSENHEYPIRYGWEIYGDQLFTDLDEVYIDYQSSINESKMPPYFINVLKYAMAAELSVVITDQIAKADYYRAVAYGTPGENGRGGLMRQAMNIDSRGRLSPVIEDYSLIDVRG
jgi:hypothetical protein